MGNKDAILEALQKSNEENPYFFDKTYAEIQDLAELDLDQLHKWFSEKGIKLHTQTGSDFKAIAYMAERVFTSTSPFSMWESVFLIAAKILAKQLTGEI